MILTKTTYVSKEDDLLQIEIQEDISSPFHKKVQVTHDEGWRTVDEAIAYYELIVKELKWIKKLAM